MSRLPVLAVAFEPSGQDPKERQLLSCHACSFSSIVPFPVNNLL